MAKHHFKFDPETLTIRKVSFISKITNIVLPQLLSTMVIALVSYYLFTVIFDKPQEKTLKYQNKQLKQQYNRLMQIYSQNEASLKILEQYNRDLYKLVLGTSYLPFEEDSSTLFENINKYNVKKLNKKNTRRTQNLINYVYESSKEIDDFLKQDNFSGEKTEFIPTITPIHKSQFNLVYGFGIRLDPIFKYRVLHTGIDFATETNAQVFATGAGVVKNIGNDNKKGKYVLIYHNKDYQTYYYNLSYIYVKENQNIKKGQKIGIAGISGQSFVPHLHYEIFYKGKPVNPVFFFFGSLTAEEFYDVFKKSSFPGISLD